MSRRTLATVGLLFATTVLAACPQPPEPVPPADTNTGEIGTFGPNGEEITMGTWTMNHEDKFITAEAKGSEGYKGVAVTTFDEDGNILSSAYDGIPDGEGNYSASCDFTDAASDSVEFGFVNSDNTITTASVPLTPDN